MTHSNRLKALLACGVVFGPLFYIVVAIQLLTRTGFDIRKHPLSLLSLGDAGWIQIANFIVTGLLAIACALGMRGFLRSGLGGTWGSLLVGTYGLGMIAAGIFPPDSLARFSAWHPSGDTRNYERTCCASRCRLLCCISFANGGVFRIGSAVFVTQPLGLGHVFDCNWRSYSSTHRRGNGIPEWNWDFICDRWNRRLRLGCCSCHPTDD